MERFHFDTHIQCDFLEYLISFPLQNETLTNLLLQYLMIYILLIDYLIFLTKPHKS